MTDKAEADVVTEVESKPSTSSKVLEWLLERDEFQTAFTSQQVFDSLALHDSTVTVGGVYGYLSKAHAMGALTAHKISRQFWYTIVPDKMEALAKFTRTKSSLGSPAGRTINRSVSRLHVPKGNIRDIIRDQLIEIAAQVESIRTPLSSYSTLELIKELAYRESHSQHKQSNSDPDSGSD